MIKATRFLVTVSISGALLGTAMASPSQVGAADPPQAEAPPPQAPSTMPPPAASPPASGPASPLPVPPQLPAEFMPQVDLSEPFAKVGDDVISGPVFLQTVNQAMRQKFYHGRVPLAELAAFQRQVGEQIVDQILMVHEARRLGVQPDSEEIRKTLEKIEEKGKTSPTWQKDRETLMPEITRELAAKSLVRELEKRIRGQFDPSTAEVRAYYDQHPEKFTAPMDQKLSLILLKVDPSAGGEAWETAKVEAAALVARLREGADFAELAKQYSGDESAANGGRLKFAHKGSLAPQAEEVIAKLSPGEITDPVVVLEGVALFRLEKRVPPELLEFSDVEKRARGLLLRELADKAWQDFKQGLRTKTPTWINEKYYLPMPQAEEGKEQTPSSQPGGGS
ncbi:MAG: peptidylprolyl isomerase [Magnetococcales bacterium]|nr:peptidylprolyl isomerase [Magnetococcales bacterium]MBF0157176.1 peptidylprolyl isomerase [Magnetococcales bacterium]